MIDEINLLLQEGTQSLRIKAAQDVYATVPSSGKRLALVCQHQMHSVDDLLPRIAAACAHLICEADFRYVRNCEGPTCSLYFLDVSKNHRRRWCSMEVCGNRAKAAAHRKR
jgi:predicted RNA-binding Zn ribbon-like protein